MIAHVKNSRWFGFADKSSSKEDKLFPDIS